MNTPPDNSDNRFWEIDEQLGKLLYQIGEKLEGEHAGRMCARCAKSWDDCQCKAHYHRAF